MDDTGYTLHEANRSQKAAGKQRRPASARCLACPTCDLAVYGKIGNMDMWDGQNLLMFWMFGFKTKKLFFFGVFIKMA